MTFYGFGFRLRTHFLSSTALFYFYFTCFLVRRVLFYELRKKVGREKNFVCNMHHNYEP